MSNNKKTLRQLYMNDPQARDFLKNHPEFDDRFLDEESGPQWDTSKGRYTTTDVREDQKQYGELMLEALRFLPEGSDQRTLLEAYYIENYSIPKLKLLTDVSSNEAIRGRIFRAKRAALKAMLSSKKIDIAGLEPEAVRTFMHNNTVKLVYLVRPNAAIDAVWCLEDGQRLSEQIQNILDIDPELKEWDLIVLK